MVLVNPHSLNYFQSFSCDKGEISVFGLDINVDKTKIQGKNRCTIYTIAHWDKLTGYENAWFFARAYGLTPEYSNSKNRIFV